MIQANSNNSRGLVLAWVFLGLLLTLFSPSSFAATDTRCEAYVQSSLLQQRENLGNAFAFGGSRWNNNIRGQRKWCLGASEKSLNLETAERSRWLAVCKTRNQKQGKSYFAAKKNCLPTSYKQASSINVQALYDCLRVSKVTVQGRKDGFQYLAYLHKFTEGYYLFDFTVVGKKVRLKKHWIGNSSVYCDKEDSGWNDSFYISGSKHTLIIGQYCDNTRYHDDGSPVSPISVWVSSSKRSVTFTFSKGAWRPIRESYDKTGSHTDSDEGGLEEYINDWRTQTFYKYTENRIMKTYFVLSSIGMSVAAGKLRVKSEQLSIGDLFPRTKKSLGESSAIDESCYQLMDMEEDELNSCEKVYALKRQIHKKGSPYYKMIRSY